jgi:hypothetical protein
LAQRAASCNQDHPGSGLKCDQFFFRHFIGRAEINAARLIHAGQVCLRFGEPAQLVGQWVVVAGHFFAHEHEIDLQAMQMPEGVCGQDFAHDSDVVEVTNHDNDNREIARDTLPPQRTLTFSAAAETRGWRPQLGLRKEDVSGKLLESLNIARADAKPAHLELGMRPSRLKSARAGTKLRVAFSQPDDFFARIRH